MDDSIGATCKVIDFIPVVLACGQVVDVFSGERNPG
jgi:hypothetical protein